MKIIEKFNIHFNSDIPKYIQISNKIKKIVNNNELYDNEKLPAIRELANYYNVNNSTIINAYKKLSEDGYVYQKIGSGTYVKRRNISSIFLRNYLKSFKDMNSKKLAEIIDFTGESNRQIQFPMLEFKDVLNRVLDRDGINAFIINEPFGYRDLRITINKIFWDNKLNFNNILIVSGAQQGIDVVSKTILNINDNIIVEKPTYRGALSVFKWRKANIFEVDINNDGVDLKKFEKILKKNKIKCFYMMSYFHNPTGISYSLEKKQKLLELAEKYDFYIIEDDYLSELIYCENLKHIPMKKLDKNDRVIYIKSFSKIFLPGIRLGYIIAPSILGEGLQNSKIYSDITTSSLMQRALELYLKDGFWLKHIDIQKKEYKKRYFHMKELIEKKLSDKVKFLDPKGGLSFYLEINDKSINSKDIYYKLKSKDVYITPGILYYDVLEEGNNFFRIGFSQVDNDKISKGLEIIKKELEEYDI